MLQVYGDGTIFGEPYGSEPVRVAWLHGWGRQGADFAVSARQLAAEGVGSVTLDLPGFGASAPPLHAGGARHYAALLLPVVQEISHSPLVIVGHSFGGRVAVSLAAQHPALVRAVVLTGVPLLARQHRGAVARAYRLVRALHHLGVLSDGRLEAARQKYGSADYRAASGVMRDVLIATVNESYEKELAQWRGATTLVWGSKDTEVPVAVASAALELLGEDSRLVELPGVGHLTPLEAPDALARAVRETLT